MIAASLSKCLSVAALFRIMLTFYLKKMKCHSSYKNSKATTVSKESPLTHVPVFQKSYVETAGIV